MSLSREDVAAIADYARIALTDEELDEMLYDEWLARDGGAVAP